LQGAERRAKKQNSKIYHRDTENKSQKTKFKIQIAGRRAQSEKTKFKKIYHGGTENTENKSQKTKFKIQIAVRRAQSEKQISKNKIQKFTTETQRTQRINLKKQKTKFKSHPDSYREQILNHKS